MILIFMGRRAPKRAVHSIQSSTPYAPAYVCTPNPATGNSRLYLRKVNHPPTATETNRFLNASLRFASLHFPQPSKLPQPPSAPVSQELHAAPAEVLPSEDPRRRLPPNVSSDQSRSHPHDTKHLHPHPARRARCLREDPIPASSRR